MVKTLQKSSSLEPKGLWLWNLVCIPGVWVTWPRWPPCPFMVKTFQKSSSPEPKGLWPWNLVCGMLAHHSLYKSWPCVDLELIYDMVNFGTLGFYMGKRLYSGFLRNYLSLRYNTWYIWSTKWPDEDIMSLKVKVILSVCPVIKNFKTSTSLKPLVWLKQNFIWSLSVIRE